MTPIQIHEFSTGINVEGTPDNWASKGFIGGYMNSTLAQIPAVVHNAISNLEFAVPEGASREEAALIGREVEGYGEAWSVVAVVTRDRDNRGRKASLYRYFLCQERGRLPDILYWYLREAGKPVFNPFDTKTVGQCYFYHSNPNSIPLGKLEDFLQENLPIIIPKSQLCSALNLNELAIRKMGDNELISWAYNVEGLEKPDRFQVIYPASEQAEQLIKQKLEKQSRFIPSIAEEQPIKKAIENLSAGRFKPEYFQTLEQNLSNPRNPQITTEFWERTFEQQGIRDAYKSYHNREARLLTLQAIILPETSVNFLDWLQKAKKKDTVYKASQELQQKVVEAIENPDSVIWQNIKKGIDLSIINLINNPELKEATVKLLSNEEGNLWGGIHEASTSKGLSKDLTNKANYKSSRIEDFPNMYVLNNEPWTDIRNDLNLAWSPQFCANSTYLPLAELFGDLARYKEDRDNLILAAFFYNFAQESVPDDIFKKCQRNRIFKFRDGKPNNDQAIIFGINVKREIPLQEQVVRGIGGAIKFLFSLSLRGKFKIPVLFHLIILLIVFTLGGLLFQKVLNSLPSLNNLLTPDKTLRKALNEFPTTQDSLQQLTTNLSQTIRTTDGQKPTKQEVSTAISDILDPTPTKFLNLKLNQDPNKWVQAILYYQHYKVKGLKEGPDGVIDGNGRTYLFLKCQLLQKMELQASQETIAICKEIGFSKISPPKSPEEQKKTKAVQEFSKDKKTKFTLEDLANNLAAEFYLSELKMNLN